MRKAAVRHGDPTTTRGVVFAFSSTIHDDGKKVALSGDEATCGNCEGTYKIFGTGKGMSEKGRCVVVHDDLVLCPCKKNRVIVGNNPGIFLEVSSGGATSANSASNVRTMSAGSSTSQSFDEPQFARRFFVWDKTTGNPMPNRAFVAEVGDKILSGKTDGQGYATIKTNGEQSVNIHVLFSSPRRRLKPQKGA